MKIIKEGHADPDFLTSLDRTKNIIMCTPSEGNSIIESENFPDSFSIAISRDLNLSASNIINVSTSALATTLRPELKISYPTGIKLVFSDFKEDFKEDLCWRIYKSHSTLNNIDKDNTTNFHVISDIKLIMYMDTIRMREAGVQMVIKKDTKLVDFYFTWYVQTKKDMPQIEEIYLISDSHIYEEFINIV